MQTIRRMTWKAIVAGLLAAAPPAAAQPGAPAPRAALLPPRPMDRGVVTRASSAELPPTGAPVTGSPADSLPLPSPVPPAPQRPARTVWNVRPTGAPVGTPLCTHCRVKNSQPTTGLLGQLVGTRLGAAPSPAPPAEKPAYRWYGYGAAAPDPQALDAHRVEVSPEFYARTGATPGALPAPHSVPMPLPRVPAGAVARAPERSGEPPLGPPGHVIGRSDSNAVSTGEPPAAGPAAGGGALLPTGGNAAPGILPPPTSAPEPPAPQPRHDLIPPPPIPSVRWQSPGEAGLVPVPFARTRGSEGARSVPPAAPKPYASPAVAARRAPAAVPMPPRPAGSPDRTAAPAAADAALARRSAPAATLRAPQVIARAQSPEASPGSAEQDPLAEAVRSAAGGAPVEVERTGPNVLRVRLRVAEAAAAEPTVNRIAALPALAPYRVDFEVEVGR